MARPRATRICALAQIPVHKPPVPASLMRLIAKNWDSPTNEIYVFLCVITNMTNHNRLMPHPKCIHALHFHELYPLPIRRLYGAYGKICLATFGQFRLATLWKSSPGHFWKISQLMLASHTKKTYLQNISSVLQFFLRVR